MTRIEPEAPARLGDPIAAGDIGAFYAWTRLTAAATLGIRSELTEEDTMGLFRRKPIGDDQVERCPRCREPLPDGADECMMCGVALDPLRGVQSSEEATVASERRRNG